MKRSPEPAERDMERVIGNLLRSGVVGAASLVFLGGLIYLFRHGAEPADYGFFRNLCPDLCSVGGIAGNVFSFHGRGFIQLGLLVLIATPVSRVFFSIFAFARQRDTLYVIITSVVFCILIYSLFIG